MPKDAIRMYPELDLSVKYPKRGTTASDMTFPDRTILTKLELASSAVMNESSSVL